MEMRFFGNTGVKVSSLCFGAMTFGVNQWGVGGVDAKGAGELVAVALDAGVNFFDTADVYAYGEAESLLGRALGRRRPEVFLATKVRGAMGEGANDVGLSRRHILESVEGSLRRLGTDYIDLYQVHAWDPKTSLEQTLRALDDLVRGGKVRYIGASNFAAWQLAKALWVADRSGWVPFESLQAYYNLVGRDLEHELLPLCLDQGLAVLPWSPLAGGWLSGKYRRDRPLPAGTRLSGPLSDFLPVDREKLYRLVDLLAVIGRAHDAPVAAAALAWLAARPGVTSVIIGARTPEQLRQNLQAAELRLTGEEIRRLDEASATPLPYPQWMLASPQQAR